MSMSGYAPTCAPHSAGVNTLHFCKASDLTSMTLASGEDYFDTITMASSNVFLPYDALVDTAEYRSEDVYENGARKTKHIIEFDMGKFTKEARTAYKELMDESDCGMIAIVTDANGNKIVVGYSEAHGKTRPLKFESGTVNTGKALTDENGIKPVLSCESKDPAHFTTATIPV